MGWMSEELATEMPVAAAAARLRQMRKVLSMGASLLAALDASLVMAITQTSLTPTLRVALPLCAVPFGLVMGWTVWRFVPEDAYREAVLQARREGRPVQVLTRRGLVALLGTLGIGGFAVIYALAHLGGG